jgi:predicted dehydrogenase
MNMEKIYGLALIGCGQMGESHIKRIYYKPNVKLQYVCDLNLEKAEELKRKYNAEFSENNVEKCIADSKVDIVICATYPSTHLEILKLCIKYGKHLICEKPITTNLEDGKEFVKLVKEHPECKVLIGHILRHNETYKKVAEVIQNDMIGHPIVMRMSQNHHTMNWPRYLNLINETSPIVDCGVHYLDVMQWVTGEKIVEISGIGSRTEPDVPVDKYNYGLVTTHLSGGSIAYYEAGWTNTIAAENTKEFIGPKGRIRIILKKDRHTHQEEGDLIEYYQYPEKIYHMINIRCDRKPCGKQFDYLIRMIEDNIEATPTIDEVFNCFELVLLADEKIKKFNKIGK